MLLSFIVKFVLYLFCKKNENKQKEAGLGQFFKKNADAKKAKYVVEGSNCLISYKCSNLGICLFLLFSHSNSNLNYINVRDVRKKVEGRVST